MGMGSMLDLMSVATPPSLPPILLTSLKISVCQLLIEIVLSREFSDDEWKTPRTDRDHTNVSNFLMNYFIIHCNLLLSK